MNKPIASLEPGNVPTGERPGSKKVYQPGVIWPEDAFDPSDDSEGAASGA